MLIMPPLIELRAFRRELSFSTRALNWAYVVAGAYLAVNGLIDASAHMLAPPHAPGDADMDSGAGGEPGGTPGGGSLTSWLVMHA